jgi:zinc/manganese transport system permease protein
MMAALYDLIIAPFVEFDFMRRALIGSFVLALSAGPMGVFLVLRRMSLVGDAMAHAILPGAAIGYLIAGLSLSAMTLGGLIAGCLVAILAGLVTRHTQLREDASLASFYIISLALGVTLVSLKGSNIDLLHVLFGSVLALDDAALILLASISSFTILVLAVIYRPLVLECVDPGFLRTISSMGAPVHLLFLCLVVINLISGFHAMGTLLAVGVLMLPAISARFWCQSIGTMMGVSCVIGILASALGLIASYHLGLASGPTIILLAGVLYFLSLLLGPQGGLLWRLRRSVHLEG